MTATISNWGNSLAVRIPKKQARMLWLSAGSEVRFVWSKSGILIKPVVQKSDDFSYLLTRDQILSLSQVQYASYVRSLSQLEREEIWRREDRDEKISAGILEELDKEGDICFSQIVKTWK